MNKNTRIKMSQAARKRIGDKNSNFRHGKYVRNKLCLKCKKIKACRYSFYCEECAHKIQGLKIKGIDNPNHKHGKFCQGKKCLDCGCLITIQADRCRPCAYKQRSLESKGKDRNAKSKRLANKTT